MPTGPKVFLAMPVECWLRPCAWTLLKWPCATIVWWWDGWQIPQYHNTASLQLPGLTSAGRVNCGTDSTDCVSAAGDFIRPQGPSPRAFTSFWRLSLLSCAWGAPNKGNSNDAAGIFGHAGRVWAPALPDPPQKSLVPRLPVWWGELQILQYRNTAPLELLGLTSCLLRHGSSRVCLGNRRFPPA